MFKKRRKAVHTVLLFIMLFSMIFGNAAAVYADDILVQSATVQSLPVISPGGSIADAQPELNVPEGCNYRAYWIKWDSEANDGFGEFAEVTDETFDESSLYKLSVEFTPEDGYTFDGYIDVTFAEGIDSEGIMTWGSWDEADNEFFYIETPVISFANAIYRIELTLPEVTPGNTAAIGDIVFYSGDQIVSNDNFDINAYWECHTDNYSDVTNKTFEKDKVYQFYIQVIPKAGYYFDESLIGSINGQELDFSYDTPTNFEQYPMFTLLDPYTSIELAGFPESLAGNILPDNLEIVSDAEDVEVYIYWEDEDYNDVTGQEIEDGKTYTAFIDINSYGDIPLSENFVFIIDGKEYAPTDLYLDSQQAFVQITIEGGTASAEVNASVETTETSENVTAGVTPVIIIAIAAAAVVIVIIIITAVRKKKK